MTVLVIGASGATGQLLVKQLLDRGCHVRVIVRSPERLPEPVKQHGRITIFQASILDLDDMEFVKHIQGCTAIASCLGHNLTLKGIYGQPRRLVTEATTRLCNAIKASESSDPAKFVLMNTAGNSNRDLTEPISLAHRIVVGGIRCFVPPHADNEKAADYLRVKIGKDDKDIQWAAVRPDTLIDEDQITDYELHPSPTRSAIFNPGKTSRINVAHFMAELITDDIIWARWRGKMPVIYNRASSGS